MAGIHTLTFSAGSTLNKSIDVTGNGQILTAKNTRLANSQYNIQTGIISQIENFVKAFEIDYNTQGDYTITFDSTTATFEHPDNDHFNNYVNATHNGTSNITSSITTTAQRTIVEVITNYSEADAIPCAVAECRLTFNQIINELTVNEYDYVTTEFTQIYTIANLNSNTVTFDVNRGEKLLYINAYVGSNLTQITKAIPKLLSVDRVDVADTSFGSSVSIFGNEDENFPTRTYGVTLASVDENPTYVTSNVFTGLTPGNYNAHIQDSFGCEKSKAFTIAQDDGTGDPSSSYKYFISQKNSVRTTYRDIKDSANPYNFLHQESPHFNPYTGYTHIYGDHQLVPTQFRSTFPKHKVSIVPCDDSLSTFELPFIQITDNIQRNTYLEGKISYNADLNRMVVSFDGGDEYDRFGNILGQHSYFGTLPYHYEVGTSLRISGQALLITSFITEDNITYAVTNSQATTQNNSITIESVHKAKDYEEYRFTMNMSLMPTKFRYKPEFLLKDNTVYNTALSEVVEVITKDELINGKYHIIEFWNTKSDSELDYSIPYKEIDSRSVGETLVGFINLRFTHTMTPIPNSQVESAKLDNAIKKLDYSSIEVFELNLEGMPIMEAARVCKIFNESENILIDGMLCTTLDPATWEGDMQIGTPKIQIAVSELINGFNTGRNDVQTLNPGWYVQTS